MDRETALQLDNHGYGEDPDLRERPLLICDVDEVVLHLVQPFEQVLNERGFYLKSRSFRLTGNVFCSTTHREATQGEVWEGLAQLFEEQSTRQAVVEGAVSGLVSVAEHSDIVFLTNCPHDYRQHRSDYLVSLGLEFPLVTNTGSKVPAIERLKKAHSGPVGFIDDTPVNLSQVREAVPDVQLFHFMADDRFRDLVGDVDGAHFSTGDWNEASHGIRTVLARG